MRHAIRRDVLFTVTMFIVHRSLRDRRKRIFGGGWEIRTPVGLLPNGFQDRRVMTASLTLHILCLNIIFQEDEIINAFGKIVTKEAGGRFSENRPPVCEEGGYKEGEYLNDPLPVCDLSISIDQFDEFGAQSVIVGAKGVACP